MLGMVISTKKIRKFAANDPTQIYKIQWIDGDITTYFSNSHSLQTYRRAYHRLRKGLENATKI